jgi:hypothetical protein
MNAIRNMKMMFINKSNPLKQIVILMKKGKTILTLSGEILFWKE